MLDTPWGTVKLDDTVDPANWFSATKLVDPVRVPAGALLLTTIAIVFSPLSPEKELCPSQF